MVREKFSEEVTFMMRLEGWLEDEEHEKCGQGKQRSYKGPEAGKNGHICGAGRRPTWLKAGRGSMVRNEANSCRAFWVTIKMFSFILHAKGSSGDVLSSGWEEL